MKPSDEGFISTGHEDTPTVRGKVSAKVMTLRSCFIAFLDDAVAS